jgi:Uma2 family endonuclease
MPEPDVAVYRRRGRAYKDVDRDANDVLLIIEVADTSLAYDRMTTMRLYAAFA